MNGYCNRCGKCCEAIRLVDFSPEYLHNGAQNIRLKAENGEKLEDWERDYLFLDEHWHPITEDEAFLRNPMLRMQKEYGLVNRKDLSYYSCDMYDAKSHLCMAHDKRPTVCSGYPYYGREAPSEYFTWYSPTCGYIADSTPGERQLMIELALEMETMRH
jgi:Fe-S-cluster containining protein